MRQRVQLRDRRDAERVDELLGGLVRERFDIHSVARGVVRQARRDLRTAGEGVGAVEMCAAHFDVCAALRAAGRLFDRRFGHVSRHCAEDFGNHVVAPADRHARADADALALDIVPVVQRSLAHGHARELDRLDMRKRRELAGSADLPRHVLDDAGRFLGGEFIRHRPARELFGVAEILAQRKVRGLDHHAVDQKIERRARGFGKVDLG